MDYMLISKLKALLKEKNVELSSSIEETLKKILRLQSDLFELNGLLPSKILKYNNNTSDFKIEILNLVNEKKYVLEFNNNCGDCYLYSTDKLLTKNNDTLVERPFFEIKFEGNSKVPKAFSFLCSEHLICQKFTGCSYDLLNSSEFPTFYGKYIYCFDFDIYTAAGLVRKKIVNSASISEFSGVYRALNFSDSRYISPKDQHYFCEHGKKIRVREIRSLAENDLGPYFGIDLPINFKNPIDGCLMAGVALVNRLVPPSRVPGNDYTLARVSKN